MVMEKLLKVARKTDLTPCPPPARIIPPAIGRNAGQAKPQVSG